MICPQCDQSLSQEFSAFRCPMCDLDVDWDIELEPGSLFDSVVEDEEEEE